MSGDPAELFSEQMRDELRLLDARLSSERRQSLPEVLHAWSRYADIVESREPIGLDDYRAMLFARDAIQELVTSATPPTGRLLEALVSHEDSRFLLGTRTDDEAVLDKASERRAWWWGRIPELSASRQC